jgi:hypothetical protein
MEEKEFKEVERSPESLKKNWDRVSLCFLGCPWTCDPPPSASWEVGTTGMSPHYTGFASVFQRIKSLQGTWLSREN